MARLDLHGHPVLPVKQPIGTLCSDPCLRLPMTRYGRHESKQACMQEVAAGAEALYLFQGDMNREHGQEAEPKLQHKLDEAKRMAAFISRQTADLEACLQVAAHALEHPECA